MLVISLIFLQKVQEVANVLPHDLGNLSSILTVLLENSDGYRDFYVNRERVRNALIRLKKNHPCYEHIIIDEGRFEKLPVNDSVYSRLRGYDIDDNSFGTDSDVSSGEADKNSQDGDDIICTDVPDLQRFTCNAKIQNALGNEVILWPSIGKKPVNEFGSPGYISMAFPHLFPYGLADYSMPRSQKVSLKEYIQHLMLFHDGRFAKDERFRYFMMNSEMRWTSLNAGSIFVTKNKFFSDMTVNQLKSYLLDHPSIAKKIMFYSSRIRSTRQYWNSRCGELLDMAEQLGSPTVFFTLSSADYHWPDLFRLLDCDVSTLNYSERSKLIANNPLVADTFFTIRSNFFIDRIFKNHFSVKDCWYRYEYQHRGAVHLHGVAWFINAPNLSSSSNEEIVSYFNKIISCINPDSNIV